MPTKSKPRDSAPSRGWPAVGRLRDLPLPVVVLMAGALQLITLLQSVRPIQPCGVLVTKFHILHFSIMCDASFFMRDAQDPSRLLHHSMAAFGHGTVYQDRPLNALTAWFISRLIRLVPGMSGTVPYSTPSGHLVSFELAVYAAYVVMDFAVLALCMYMVSRLLAGSDWRRPFRAERPAIAIIGFTAVAANRLLTWYFWSPHAALFNELFAVYLVFLIVRFSEKRPHRDYVLQAVLIGIAGLFYPLAFLAVLPPAIGAVLTKRWGGVAAIAVAPTFHFAWIWLIGVLGGVYVNDAASRFREFAWILDAFMDDQLPQTLLTNGRAFLGSLSLGVLTLLGVVAVLVSHGWREATWSSHLRITAGLSMLMYFAWVMLVGIYDYRFTWGVELASLLLLLRRLGQSRPVIRREQAVLLTISALWFANWVVYRGPFY